jgi:hypothetical protein
MQTTSPSLRDIDEQLVNPSPENSTTPDWDFTGNWNEWVAAFPRKAEQIRSQEPEWDVIEFKRKRYKARRVFVPTVGNVLVSVIALSDKLMTKDGGYVSEEAGGIDTQICYFVSSEEINLPDLELGKLVYEESYL